MTDPARPWAQPLVLRLCYCRNDPAAQRAFRRLPPRAMQRLLAKRSSIERRAAASVHDLESLHQRLLLLHQAIFEEGCGITEDEANKEREWVALMRERLKAHTAALDTQRAAAAAHGDAHYVALTDRLRSVLGRVAEVATDYLHSHLRVLIREGLANADVGAPWLGSRRRPKGPRNGDDGSFSDDEDSGSDEEEEGTEGEEEPRGPRGSRQGRKARGSRGGGGGGAAAAARGPQGAAVPARPRPPAPLTDLLADYRRAALAFECYRDPTVFTRPPGGGEPSSAGARFFAGAGAPDGAGESAGGPAAPQRIFGLRTPNRRQVMLGNASHFFREQRMPLLAPPPSRLTALVARLAAAGQLPGQTPETAGQTGAAEAAEEGVPSVAELAEVSLGGCDPPPLRVLQRRAASLEGELMYGTLRHVLRDQRLAAEAAGEPDAAVPAARRASATLRAAAAQRAPLFGVDGGGGSSGRGGREDAGTLP